MNNTDGLIKGKSTPMIKIKLIETIIDELWQQKHSTTLFLDFSKAFDCLSHDLIMTT